MKIAIVHDWLTGMRGGEKCLEVLCRHFPEAQLFTLLHAPGSTSPTIERMRISTSFLQRLPGVERHYRYLLPLMPKAVERMALPSDVDLVVSLSHAVAKSVKPPPGVPHVCYCFTPMRYAWHHREDYFAFSGRLRDVPMAAARNLVLRRIRHWDQATSERVSHFVAISQTIAKRITECYGRPSRIIYPPVDTRFYTPADVPREDFYLCISALVPYKRIDLAIRACNMLGRRLIVIGDGPERKELAQLAGETVTLTGRLDDQQLRNHLRRASALVFPAHEDFGIVPVEAMACGTPVLAYGAGGATETVVAPQGNSPGTGLFFEEQTPEALAAAIEQFEVHRDHFDPQLARQQAERFTVERFERELVGHLEQVAGSKMRDFTPAATALE